MKSLLTILLIILGMVFYSCKENTIDPKDANDFVISISPEIVSTGDTVNIKIKKNELTNQSFRTFINLIEVDPISFTENNDNYLLKARIPTYAKNGEIWLQFNGTVYESNKKFKVFKIDTLLTKIISKNEFEIKVLGYGLNYLKDAEFWFGWKNYSVTSISDTMLYFKFNMDVTNINETFRIKRNSIIYQRNIILKYDYYFEFANPIIEFGNIIFSTNVAYADFDGRPAPFGHSYSGTSKEDLSLAKVILTYNGFKEIASDSSSRIFRAYNRTGGYDTFIYSINDKTNSLIFKTNRTIDINNGYNVPEYETWNLESGNLPFIINQDTLKVIIYKSDLSTKISLFSYNYRSYYQKPYGYYERTKSSYSFTILDNAFMTITFIKK